MTRTHAPRDTTSAQVARDQRPATQRTIAYARDLVRDRDVLPGMGAADALAWFDATLAEHGMTQTQASAFIDRAKAAAHRTHTTRVGGQADTTSRLAEPGFYTRGDDAFKVQWNAQRTGTYALRWDGDGWVYAPGVGRTLADLEPMTAEQAAHLGLASGKCIACCRTLGGKTLSAQVSAVIGYGETCAGHHGWTYPTGVKAQRAYLANH